MFTVSSRFMEKFRFISEFYSSSCGAGDVRDKGVSGYVMLDRGLSCD